MARAPVVAVLNMKGGVGKTTLSAHLMRELYRRKKISILLIDIDPQFNLSQCVLTQEEYDKLLAKNQTVVSIFEPEPSSDFFDIKTTDKAPPDPSKLVWQLKHLLKTKARLDLICGDFNLVKYSLVDDSAKLNAAFKHFKRFMSQARDGYDLVVLDCNPSSSFMTHCALHTCTHIVSPVRPDKYSVIGVNLVKRLLDRMCPDPSPTHLILMNGVKRGSAPDSIESELRASAFGPNVLANRLHTSKLLASDPFFTGFATDRKVAHTGTLRTELNQLADELAAKLGII